MDLAIPLRVSHISRALLVAHGSRCLPPLAGVQWQPIPAGLFPGGEGPTAAVTMKEDGFEVTRAPKHDE